MKTNLILMTLLWLAISQLSAQKMTTHWYRPTMNEYQAMDNANYDRVIFDIENIFNNPEMIDLMIIKNPNIELFPYWNLVEWFDPMFTNKPWSMKMLDALKKRPGYWLKQTDGKNVVFWKGTKMINITEFCPKIKGKNYREFIIDSLRVILTDERFKGVFVDNLWTNIDWLAHYGNNKDIDANLDGRPDDPEILNNSFQREIRLFINDLRKIIGEDRLIIANPGNLTCLDKVDGKEFENFPDQTMGDLTNDGWNINMSYAKNGKSYNIFNARADNLFFTLCSAALRDNISVSFKQNEPWHDFYRLNLGKALGKETEIKPYVYQRQFENGLVTVNAKLAQAKIKYKNGSVRTDAVETKDENSKTKTIKQNQKK